MDDVIIAGTVVVVFFFGAWTFMLMPNLFKSMVIGAIIIFWGLVVFELCTYHFGWESQVEQYIPEGMMPPWSKESANLYQPQIKPRITIPDVFIPPQEDILIPHHPPYQGYRGGV
jgi:hypothetical protein